MQLQNAEIDTTAIFESAANSVRQNSLLVSFFSEIRKGANRRGAAGHSTVLASDISVLCMKIVEVRSVHELSIQSRVNVVQGN